MKESAVQTNIRLALGGRDCVLWRNETGATVPVTIDELKAAKLDPRVIDRLLARGLLSYGLCKGSSDLIGMRREDGRFVAIEVKRPGGNRRPEQHNFIELVRSFGGLAGFAENIEQARSIIK